MTTITNIEIQTSSVIYRGNNLLPVHNPLAFICNVIFTGDVPINLSVSVTYDGLTQTFRAVKYNDLSATIRQFIFFADSILRSYMSEFNDQVQSGNSISYINNITKEFTIKFFDPQNTSIYDEVEIVAQHATRQIGQTNFNEEIFDNEDETYIFYKNKQGYIYVYNDGINNIIDLSSGTLQYFPLTDFDDDTFIDFDNDVFEAQIII